MRPPTSTPARTTEVSAVPSSTISVVIADDELLARKGLRVWLRGEADITVVGEASSGPEAVKAIEDKLSTGTFTQKGDTFTWQGTDAAGRKFSATYTKMKPFDVYAPFGRGGGAARGEGAAPARGAGRGGAQ